MNKILYIVHQYVTKVLLIPLLAYAFLTHACPTCQYRLEANSPAFFTQEHDETENKTNKVTTIEIETDAQEETNA